VVKARSLRCQLQQFTVSHSAPHLLGLLRRYSLGV
jgi:hypothetical protein